MGGIRVNSLSQVIVPPSLASSTTDLLAQPKCVPNLFAAGEVACGVHGKNRLAGNSLLECVVFGRIAGYRYVRGSFIFVFEMKCTVFLSIPYSAVKGDVCALIPSDFTPLKLKETEKIGKF